MLFIKTRIQINCRLDSSLQINFGIKCMLFICLCVLQYKSISVESSCVRDETVCGDLRTHGRGSTPNQEWAIIEWSSPARCRLVKNDLEFKTEFLSFQRQLLDFFNCDQLTTGCFYRAKIFLYNCISL